MAGAISNLTTNLSNLSVEGTASFGTISGVSTAVASVFSATGANASSFLTISASQITSTTTITGSAFISTGAPNSSLGSLAVVSNFVLGAATNLKKILAVQVPFVATTVAATKSTLTEATVSSISSTDYLIQGAVSSGLSNGVTLQSWCTTDGKLVLNFSNVSTANAAQIAGTLFLVSIRT